MTEDPHSHRPERLEALEAEVAHLTRAVEDLSGVVARQDKVIDRLERRVQMLLEREAERLALGGEAVPIDRPPHY